jgi:hypothetical protein
LADHLLHLLTTGYGPKRHFAATQQTVAFRVQRTFNKRRRTGRFMSTRPSRRTAAAQINQPPFDGRGKGRNEYQDKDMFRFSEEPARSIMAAFGYM